MSAQLRSIQLAAALALTTLALGIAVGAKAFGCKSDELGSDHVLFQAVECAQLGTELLCRRTVAPR